MQPLQCVLQQHLHIHAAITLRFASARYTRCSTEEEPIRPRNDRRTRRTQEVPFIAACSHFTRKNARFPAPASSPTQVSCNIHAAITMRIAATRTHPCSHYITICIHSLQNTEEEPIHRGGTFHRRLQPLYTDKHKVSCSGSSPTQVPCNIHAAITMRFAATPTHPCSHYSAICIQTLQNTEEKPIRPRNDRSRIRSTQEVPFIAACSHFTRKNARFPAPASSPTQVPCNIMQHSCSHYNAFCSNTYTTMQPLHYDLHPLVILVAAQRTNRFDPETTAAPAAHRRYLSSLPAATLHGKTPGFVLRLPPQHKSHATFMQPLQCVLLQHLHIHAAITPRFTLARYTRRRTQRGNRFDPETAAAAPAAHKRYLSSPPAATLHGKTPGFLLQLPPQHKSHATFMQPLQCVLQQHLHTHAAITLRLASARYTRCSTEEEPIRPRNERTRRRQEVPFIAACSHFTQKNTRFRGLASLPTQVPCNIYAAITMRFAATPTHPCSHCNAFCIHTLQNTKGEAIRPRNDCSRTRRTQEVPFIAACSHFTRKNARFRAPASSPTQIPCNIHAAITMRLPSQSVLQQHLHIHKVSHHPA